MYCPKLCRTACPVSNAEPRETLTPWGKVSMLSFVANESVAAAPAYAAPAWACTDCGACTAACDHDNDAGGLLLDGRSALAREGLAPPAAASVLARFAGHEARLAEAESRLASIAAVRADAPRAVLVGCSYLTKAPDVAEDAVRAVAALSGGHVALARGCCGLPLLHAGDEEGFREHGRSLLGGLADKASLVVVDAGCASAIQVHLARAGVTAAPRVVPFPVFVATAIGALGRDPSLANGPVRYHDPCRLGRGLGVYEEPRAILTQALGRAPDEFVHAREHAHCSGAGGLLPVTMPEVARTIADTRLAEHAAAGGGTVVTACASSLRSFRARGARAEDLASVVARALGVSASSARPRDEAP